jgi:integrase
MILVRVVGLGFTRERVDGAGVVRYQATYRDIKGRQRALGTFATRAQAERAWQRAEERQAEGRAGDPRRGRQRLATYITDTWLPNHEMEARTRETYTYYLDKHILPVFGGMRLIEISPADVRGWVADLKRDGHSPTVIRQAHTILSAAFTTAFNDQLTALHPCRGVKTPPIPRKIRTIITPEEFDRLHAALPSPAAQLLAELDIETGLRWGELTELRPADFDTRRRVLTVRRGAVELTQRFHPDGGRFLIKDYPKDREHRRVSLASPIASALTTHITAHRINPDALIFTPRLLLPDPAPLPVTFTPGDHGWTEPNPDGRRYAHGTTTAYAAARCRCPHCRAAVAAYRATRRANGFDNPRGPRRTVDLDAHIPRNWFRETIWKPALLQAGITTPVRPHDLRHAHASWLLAGGVDIYTVQQRLGHASITTTEKYLHTLTDTDDTALDALAMVRRRHRQT